MALIEPGPEYTRSGGNEGSWAGFFTKWANRASFIPILGGAVSFTLGMIGSGLESLGWLAQGKVLSAATVLATGAVSNSINSAVSTGLGPLYWGQLASGAVSGTSLGTHSRALTESVIGGVTGLLGVKPTVLRSYTAGLGSGPGAGSMSGPGYYATMHGGANPQAKWDNFRNGAGAEHVSALEAARAAGPNQRAM
jgi:hypothetical protein